jgi:hypothetical protein
MTALNPKDFDLYRLIAINAYTAYRNTVVGNPAPAIAEQYARTTNPQPGDLVLEVSTIWKQSRYALEAPRAQYPELGFLLRVEMEPFPREEGETEPDDGAREKVWYIQPLDGSVPEYRWVNANFIRVFTELER